MIPLTNNQNLQSRAAVVSALLLACASSVFPAHAQEPEAATGETTHNAAARLPDVVVNAAPERAYSATNAVTATKTDRPLMEVPQSIQVVPQEVLKDQQVVRLDEAVRNVSGVSKAGDFANQVDRFNIRGFQQSTFLRNGLYDDGSYLREMASVERVEVVKGPASVLYGRLEPGGVINLLSKRPLSQPYYNFEMQAGSYDFYRPSVDMGGPVTDDGSLLYRFNAVYQNAGSFRAFMESERFFAAPSLTWNISEATSLTVELEGMYDKRGLDRGLVAVGADVADVPRERFLGEPGDFRRARQLNAGYLLDHQFNETWSLRQGLRASLLESEDFRAEPEALNQSTGDLTRRWRANDRFDPTYSVQTDLIGQFATGKIEQTLLGGIELTRVENHIEHDFSAAFTNMNIYAPTYGAPLLPLDTRALDSDNRTHVLGVYLQDQVTLWDKVHLLVGGRMDAIDVRNINKVRGTTVEQQDLALTPRVGLSYRFVPSLSAYASYSGSFLPAIGTAADGRTFDPMRGIQYEAGMKGEWLDGRLSATLAVFEITKENVVVPANLGFSTQIGEQRSRGLEFDISGEILPGWRILGSYAFLDTEITEDTRAAFLGKPFPNVPEHSGSLWTTYEFQQAPLKGLGLGAGVFLVDERPGDLANTFFLDGYARVDAAIFYRRDRWRFALNAKNLMDTEYADNATDRLRITPGTPLTLMGSVSVTF
jgi:iron complex outermembrane recepter protein